MKQKTIKLFATQIPYTEEDLCIEFLENLGYFVSDERNISNDYDYVDNCLFEDISSVFDSLSCAGR